MLVAACCHSCTGILSLTSRTDLTQSRMAQGSRTTEHIVGVLPQNSHTSSLNVMCYTSRDYTEHGHSFLISDTIFLSEHKPCGDLRPHLSGALAEPPDPLQCQLIGGMPRFLGPFPGGLSRFIPCQMCAQYSGLRHLGWPSRGHVLSSRPQESCNREALDALFGLPGYPTGAVTELMGGTLTSGLHLPPVTQFHWPLSSTSSSGSGSPGEGSFRGVHFSGPGS